MTAADLDRLSSAFDSSIRQVCWQMVAADQWRRAAAASMRWHDGYHCHAPCCCQKRQHRSRWRLGAATLCYRRVRAAAAAERPDFQRLVCAIAEWDACVAGGDPCALGEIRTGQCCILGGVAAQTIAVAAKMELCARVGRVCHLPNGIVTFVCARYECRVSA